MEVLFLFLGLLVVFALLSWFCGYDSTERFDNAERERREHWQGFSGK